MNTRWVMPLVVAASVAATGCSDSSSSRSTDTASGPQTSIRVIHASPDAPLVDVLVNGDEVIAGADYKEAALLNPSPDSHEITVNARLPDGSTSTVIGPITEEFEEEVRYDLIAVGSVADDSLEALLVEDEASPSIPEGQVRLRVAHLAEGVGEVDVYLSDPEDGIDLATTDANFTFDYRDVVEPVLLDAGSYQIQVASAGATTAVYDSGAVDLPAGADLLISAVTNTGVNADASPISLLTLSGEDRVADLFDVDQGAGLRAVHNAADAPNIDVFVDGEGTPTISNLAFTETAPTQNGFDSYLSLEPGDTNVQVTATGDTEAVIDAELPLVNGQGLTLMAVGLLADIEALVLEDSARAIATQASLRVVHGSTQAGSVDVYLVPAGEDINNSEPVLTNLAFQDVSDYLAVPEGIYDVLITTAGTGTVAVTVGPVELDNGRVYTAVARDQDGGAAVSEELILLDDFTL